LLVSVLMTLPSSVLGVFFACWNEGCCSSSFYFISLCAEGVVHWLTFFHLPFLPLISHSFFLPPPALRVEGPSKLESKAAKGAEMLKMLETTSAADLAAAADARKESAYMDSVRCMTEFVSQK